MGIDSESDVAANLVIGPTSAGRVRIYVEADGVDLPMDFDPDEALEIAEELRAAAAAARKSRDQKRDRDRRGRERPAGGSEQGQKPRRSR